MTADTPERAARLYRALLALYPREFRDRFGDDMLALVVKRAQLAASTRTAKVVWLRAFADLIANAALERARTVRELCAAVVFAGSPTYPPRNHIAMHTLLQDIRYAIRGILARPAFSAIIVATLALGIGANTAIFSVVEGVMLRALPYQDPSRIVHMALMPPMGSNISEGEFVDYRDQMRSFSRTAAHVAVTVTFAGKGDPEQIELARVSDGWFSILGTVPALGRTFTADEDVRGAPRVAMISYGLWQRQYGGDTGVINKTLQINGTPFTIVGVTPRYFDYPAPDIQVWVPLRLNYAQLWSRNNHYLQVIARLAPGQTVESAQREAVALAQPWPAQFTDIYAANTPPIAQLTPINDALLGRTRPYLFSLLGAVAFVLIIACVNVANLLLASTGARRREIAIRTALGATRGRIIRQVLTESAMYAMAGALCGLPLAWWGWRTLRALAPDSIPRIDQIALNIPVLVFTLIVATLTGLFFGIVPALRASKSDGGEALTSGTRAGQGRSMRRASNALVVCEVALAVVTLTGAGLMLRSLSRLQSVELGMDPSRVLSTQIVLSPNAYQNEQRVAFFNNLINRLEGTAGVQSAAAIADLPIADGMSTYSILIDNQPMTTVALSPAANPESVTPKYFSTLGIPIIEGRAFTDADHANAPLVVIVNEAMVRKFWPGKSGIGHTIKMLNETAPWATVVGVVRDVRHGGYQAQAEPTMYFPYEQASKSVYTAPNRMSLVAKATGNEQSLAAPIRQIVRELDPAVPVARVQSMSALIDASVAGRRFSTQLIGLFAALALTLAAIGIYGVISYGVSQRRFELGLRVALGAQRGEVFRLIMREGLVLALLGMGGGVVGAMIVMQFARSMLVDVSVGDPITLVIVAALLGAVATIASYVPARRVLALDPTTTLRGG